MRPNRHNILVTRLLNGPQIEYARNLGLEPILRPALEFEFPDYWDRVLKVINKHPKSDWVFTSPNGVAALEKMTQEGLRVSPETRVYAVGSKTGGALQALGVDAITPRRQTGRGLADLIVRQGQAKSVIYFHGNLSRDEMTEILAKHGIEVIEAEVYKTVVKAIELPEEPVEAILFYSPSAVEGFKRGAGFDRELPPLFAIGPTTAEALRREVTREVFISGRPDTETLLRTVADHILEPQPDSPPLKGSNTVS